MSEAPDGRHEPPATGTKHEPPATSHGPHPYPSRYLASETGDWSHVDLYLTKTQDYRALFFAGSIWDEQALEWMTERQSTWVSVGAGVDGGPLRDAAVTVRYTGDDSPRVAQLAEVLVAESVAGHWFQLN